MTPKPRQFSPLFAEIPGNKLLHEKIGDAEADQAVERCFNRIERAIATFRGRMVRRSGHQIMAVFETAEDALHAACEMQQRIGKLPAISGIKLAIGIGFHYGPAEGENNDTSGETVMAAARIVKLAKLGQIIVSGAAVAALPPALRQTTRALDLPPLNVGGKNVGIFEAIWNNPEDPAGPTIRLPVPSTARLRLHYEGKEVEISAVAPLITLGRDEHSDIVIGDPRASRHHCRIELRRDTFVLVDSSTNGTFVTPDGAAEQHLKHKECILKDRGRICFGQMHAEGVSSIEYATC